MGAISLLLSIALLAPRLAIAHAADADVDTGVEPWLVILLAGSAALYLAGVLRLWRQAGRGRGIRPWQAAAFAAGWLTLAGALVGPVDEWGAQLFAAHMVQHELLMIVAAPLLVVGRPLAAWTWAFGPRQRQWLGRATHWRWLERLWSWITGPLVAWALHALAIWVWHVPALFEAALHHEWVHILQHTSFLGTALLFWWSVLGGDPRSTRSGFALVSVFTTMLHTGALGALLTFATSAWYPTYAVAGGALGFTPVEDQQIGGLVMWVPGGAAYLVAGLLLVARLLARDPVTRASAARPVPTR
jgi:putative membrane protein